MLSDIVINKNDQCFHLHYLDGRKQNKQEENYLLHISYTKKTLIFTLV